jgi:hypothetical protein
MMGMIRLVGFLHNTLSATIKILHRCMLASDERRAAGEIA